MDVVAGPGRELPAAEGGDGVHPRHGGDGGGRRLVHQDQHHPQVHGAQVQGENPRVPTR